MPWRAYRSLGQLVPVPDEDWQDWLSLEVLPKGNNVRYGSFCDISGPCFDVREGLGTRRQAAPLQCLRSATSRHLHRSFMRRPHHGSLTRQLLVGCAESHPEPQKPGSAASTRPASPRAQCFAQACRSEFRQPQLVAEARNSVFPACRIASDRPRR
jgi:hypothetical protein